MKLGSYDIKPKTQAYQKNLSSEAFRSTTQINGTNQLCVAVQVTDGAIMRKSFLGNSWAPIHSPLNATAYLSVVGYVLSFLAIIDSLLMATTRVIRIEVI